jgi:hypothetical protein
VTGDEFTWLHDRQGASGSTPAWPADAFQPSGFASPAHARVIVIGLSLNPVYIPADLDFDRLA